ncbi:acetyl-CoA hydrolase/transferase family protein [Flammeovirga sp. SJP92]|uniref:acetyl-CoA hydrolase/transferase family protein n=1 Tax=Flammeovirga sp. SJP92 TaxID=1775430 RepID=UPI000789A49F|nr:acetyl-CoA hydrolase/transferase family protein [Flammeovirga sp. SJP92]KXX68750.1 acetyl-CoA hydrolase [Flammeovirga sp. SJP92]
MPFKILTPEEAASYVHHNTTVAFSGFTPAGSPKVVSKAIAEKAKKEHEAGREFKIGMITGASTGDSLDGELARANAVKFRTPYQSNKDMRGAINNGHVEYFDMHLSALAQEMRYGFFGEIDVAIIEAADITPNGEVVLTSGVGISPTATKLAKKVIIELNSNHPKFIKGLHDIYQPLDPPYRKSIPVYSPDARIGEPVLRIEPSKIMGIVETNAPDEVGGFAPVDEVTQKIGDNVANFLAGELAKGTIPKEFLPIQSGVGNIANAVLGSLGKNPGIPPFRMYTEVIQDAVIDLMKNGDITFASGCSLTVSPEVLKDIYGDFEFFRDKLVLRPQEISNNPEIVRQLGLITINTAIEADIFGNINSTHVLGTKMMNGIGGSGDFTRNSFLSIFTCPSVAKGGNISAIVPMVSHEDHSEHSVKVIITEQGVADLRGKSPRQRAEAIIENCVHPDYKSTLREYLEVTSGHPQTPQALDRVFNMHSEFMTSGDMRNTKW